MQKKARSRYKSGIKQKIIEHISSNIDLYIKVIIIFIIGICIGIAIVNQLPENSLQSIYEYINNSLNVLKENTEISKIQMLKSSLFKNVVIVLLIWFFGLTLLGGFVLYFLILIIGITFGYTLSAIMTSLTFLQGILFFITTLLFQNIIYIPAIIYLVVHGLKTQKSILNKQNTSIKYIVVKHSAYCIIVMILLVIASLIEVFVSGNLIYYVIKYL